MGLHNVSDFLIFLAYFLIPVALVRFVRQRPDLPYRGTMVLFGAFIYACGTTHLIDIILFHYPVYVLSGWVNYRYPKG
jgi:hypothetical protein